MNIENIANSRKLNEKYLIESGHRNYQKKLLKEKLN